VARRIHDAHSAFAEDALDAVLVGDELAYGEGGSRFDGTRITLEAPRRSRFGIAIFTTYMDSRLGEV
jgi:hypothetical protein